MENIAARKRKQVPEGYLIIGIDPHKKRHAAVAITQDFTTRDKFKFDNTKEGLETGGHYWRNVAYFLDEQGIPFRFINQFTLKRRREGKDLNRRKNDYLDSEVAAQLLCTGEFIDTKLQHGAYAELRAAYNACRRLVKERTRITNLVKGLLNGIFPEFTRVFKDPCGQTALSVLSICSIPTVIAQMTEEEFINTISVGHKGRLMKRKLCALHYAARTSIGIEAGAQSVSFEISFLVEKLQLTRRQVRIIDETLTGLVDNTEEGKYLLSIDIAQKVCWLLL